MRSQLFVLDSLGDLSASRASITLTVKETGYALLRGLFNQSRISKSLDAIYRYANSARHGSSNGMAQADIRRNTSKWSIRSPQTGPARFAVVVYNPLFDSDVFQMHSAFERLIAIRDIVADRPILRDSELLPERFNACRIQIYPAGGGFIAEHLDDKGAANLPLGPYVETLLLLTQRDLDYSTGGAFVKFNNTVLDPEKEATRGDVLVYDANTVHGVMDVDAHIPFDARNLRGRAVAVASIYK